jgi:hypothetical protein
MKGQLIIHDDPEPTLNDIIDDPELHLNPNLDQRTLKEKFFFSKIPE